MAYCEQYIYKKMAMGYGYIKRRGIMYFKWTKSVTENDID